MAKKIQEKPKLVVELIPKTCQYSNVRTTLSAKYWDQIRFLIYEKAEHKCEICGNTGLEQGYKHRVECHEIWKYNDTKKIQKLIGLIALCPLCHQVKHIGRASFIGKEAQALQQLCVINNWTQEQTLEHVSKAFEKNKERSQFTWSLDLKLLTKPPYNISIDETKKRKFKKKFKAKRKRPRKKRLNKRPSKKA